MGGPAKKKRRAPDLLLTEASPPHLPPLTSEQYRVNPSYRNSRAIVFDLGTSALRAGFSAASGVQQSYPPVVARVRDPARPNLRNAIGWEALGPSLRSAARQAYEAGIPNNGALTERLLDGTLLALGLGNEDSIDHRFVLTEPPCQPNAARAVFMEVLFEGYGAPGVCFGVDALFSYLYNCHVREPDVFGFKKRNSLIVSCGHASTHVLPVVDGNFSPVASKRIDIGGMHMTNNFGRRLRLLNPSHAAAITTARVERLKEELCYVSEEFDEELRQIWQCTETYEQALRIVKIPYIEGAEKPKLTEEELERQRKLKIENGKRFSEMMKEKRRAKAEAAAGANGSGTEGVGSVEPEAVTFTEEEVKPLYDLLGKRYALQRIAHMKSVEEDEFYMAMVLAKIADSESLMKCLADQEDVLATQRDKLGHKKADAAESAYWKRVHEEELLSVPDGDLSAPMLKRKRLIKAMRGAAESRLRLKREKEEKLAREIAQEEALQKRREEDPEGYLKELREKRGMLAEKIKRRTAAKQAGSDRRSLANRKRMKLLAEHAGARGEDEEATEKPRGKTARGKRGRTGTGGAGSTKKGAGRSRPGKKKGEDDDFGVRDSDWDVYKDMQVRKTGDESDDGDLADEESLKEVRRRILEMVPDEDDPTIVKREGSALLFEPHPFPGEIPVVLERLRVPELVFQPSLIGYDQCGLIEAMTTCVRSVDNDDLRRSVVSEVFISGGVGSTRGLEERIRRDLRMAFPTEWGADIGRGIWKAEDPMMDAWKGAALFAEKGGQAFDDGCVFRKDYDEMGPDYIKEHLCSNSWVPTPVIDRSLLDPKKKKQKVALANKRFV